MTIKDKWLRGVERDYRKKFVFERKILVEKHKIWKLNFINSEPHINSGCVLMCDGMGQVIWVDI